MGFDGEQLRLAREEQLRASTNAPLVKNPGLSSTPETIYPNVYKTEKLANPLAYLGGRFALPVGTVRLEDDPRFDQVIIPFPKVANISHLNNLIQISSLDEFCARGFKGYTNLNRVQSLVYPIAYNTNENMLICAPTGAGKTDVAMLTVLRCISQYTYANESGSSFIAKNDFKIVYVAPMKALAAEIVRKFSSRLGGNFNSGGIGLSVRELTGDMQLTKTEIANTQMIVT